MERLRQTTKGQCCASGLCKYCVRIASHDARRPLCPNRAVKCSASLIQPLCRFKGTRKDLRKRHTEARAHTNTHAMEGRFQDTRTFHFAYLGKGVSTGPVVVCIVVGLVFVVYIRLYYPLVPMSPSLLIQLPMAFSGSFVVAYFHFSLPTSCRRPGTLLRLFNSKTFFPLSDSLRFHRFRVCLAACMRIEAALRITSWNHGDKERDIVVL